MSFTFKKDPPATGLSAVGNSRPSTDIKRGGKVVGRIHAPNWQTKDGKWGVGLMVAQEVEEGYSCDWKWVFFKARFDSEPEAREWLKRNEGALVSHYEIRGQDA